MTIRRLLGAAGALGVLALPLLTGTAHADTTSPAPSGSASAATAVAGSSFRTAAPLTAGQNGRANGAIGDYFYWSFQATAGEAPSVTATVQLPSDAHRQGTETWRLDLYDGLRRVQPCVGGSPAAQAAAGDSTVQLSCTLPSIRSWGETWSNAPLPGTYYVRLTVGDLTEQDLGMPVGAQLSLTAGSGDDPSSAGSLPTPLSLPSAGPSATSAASAATPGASTPTDGGAAAPSASASAAAAASASGSSSGGLSGLFAGGNARWWWTGGGAVAASLAGVAGFSLTRHPRRWFS